MKTSCSQGTIITPLPSMQTLLFELYFYFFFGREAPRRGMHGCSDIGAFCRGCGFDLVVNPWFAAGSLFQDMAETLPFSFQDNCSKGQGNNGLFLSQYIAIILGARGTYVFSKTTLLPFGVLVLALKLGQQCNPDKFLVFLILSIFISTTRMSTVHD